ncbi:uroplakin-3b-like protein 1 [Macrotis lagotis]|uniref:uroplakin-3b-like protein 1 n=1 Tax=Macrotis lagotis TaxID=92651 RepID=UPI003D68E065
MGLPPGWFFPLLLLLVTSIPTEASLEKIDYVPVLTRKLLEGNITSSTFTLDQPSGQFNSPSIKDIDDIWLVVAFSNATENFTAPQSPQSIPQASTFLEKKYYMTLRASQTLYSNKTKVEDIRVLRVGNENNCTVNSCNKPLPGPGPYRVKFLVMNSSGPVAETKWSDNITLIKPVEFLETHSSGKSTGTIVIIVILSILLSLLFVALVALLVYTCFDTCGTEEISGTVESIGVRRYNTHHTYSSPDATSG